MAGEQSGGWGDLLTLDGATKAVGQVGDIASKGLEIYNKVTGQNVGAPGAATAQAPGVSAAVPVTPAVSGLPAWLVPTGLALLALIAGVLVFGGRKGSR